MAPFVSSLMERAISACGPWQADENIDSETERKVRLGVG